MFCEAIMKTFRCAPRVLAAIFVFAVAGCAGWPRDQSGTVQRVSKTRVLAVGVSDESGDAPHRALQAREKVLVQRLAKKLGARVEWRRGNVHTLLEELEENKIALVAATLPADSPFAERVAMTKPYQENGPDKKSYALAVAPGENALLLLADKIIAQTKQEKSQ